MAYRHQPIGFLPEVSQLLGVSLELHAGCDAGQPVLDVLCRSLVHFIAVIPVSGFIVFFYVAKVYKIFYLGGESYRTRFSQRIT